MKTAIVHSPYWNTEGGGEKYAGSVVQFLLKSGFKVEVAWTDPALVEKLKSRFDLDISGANINPIAANIINKPGRWWEKWLLEKEFELSFWVSDGSIPWGLAKNNILHFQVPFHPSSGSKVNSLKLKTFQAVICNSIFTKKVIDRTFGSRSLVVYPPVTQFPGLTKRKLILSVGRFDSQSHNKRHDVLIEAFKDLGAGGWDLVIAGGLMHDTQATRQLKKQATGFGITIMENPSFEIMKKLYGEASIYWHAAGFGEDLLANPEKAEHFGIATAEAMSAGAVPVVFNGGGQPEIISEGVNGYLWDRIEELQKKTMLIMNSRDLQHKLSVRAVIDAQVYSREEFERHFTKLIS